MSSNNKIIFTFGIIITGLFLLLDLMGMDTDDTDNPSITASPGISIPDAKTTSVAGTFTDQGILFVVFERGGQVYLNYNQSGRWLDNSLALNLFSDYGVEAVIIQNPRPQAPPFVCLFLKDGSQTKGTIQYSCSRKLSITPGAGMLRSAF